MQSRVVQVARLQAEISRLRATLDSLRADHHEQNIDMQHLIARAELLQREQQALRERVPLAVKAPRGRPLVRIIRQLALLGAAGLVGARVHSPVRHAALTG
jgi:hypothetical protein